MTEGFDELIKMLGKVSKNMVPDTVTAMQKGTSFVRDRAADNCLTDSSELKGSIHGTVKTEHDRVQGIVYTNAPHGPYVELGTGPKGQEDHEGISPEVNPVYTQKPWWIHESQIDQETAEKYHFFKIETKNGIFYQTSGQAANPFMYPALKDNEEQVVKIVKSTLGKKIKKVME